VGSVLPTLIGIAILAVIAYLIWRMRPTREALQRKRALAAGVTDEVITEFEQRAVHIARSILNTAIDRLRSAADQHCLPSAETLSSGDDGSGTLQASRQIRGAARELAGALNDCRRLHEQAFGSPQYEQAEEHWAYLSVVYSDRYPLLTDFIERSDLVGLDRIGTGTAWEAARLLRSELDVRLNSYRQVLSALEDNPSIVWSMLSLVVLTLAQLDLDDAKQAALAARANARCTDSWIALLNAQLKSALRIAHTVPPGDRIRHKGVLALPLEDRDLGAALVQYAANEATALGELDQARVLVMGDSAMLWLAHDVIRARAYPDQAVRAYAQLAPLVRVALRTGADEAKSALAALSDAAEEQLGAQTRQRVMLTVEQLRAGRTAEQIRGGTAGYEVGSG
jgi:hypothetical protein